MTSPARAQYSLPNDQELIPLWTTTNGEGEIGTVDSTDTNGVESQLLGAPGVFHLWMRYDDQSGNTFAEMQIRIGATGVTAGSSTTHWTGALPSNQVVQELFEVTEADQYIVFQFNALPGINYCVNRMTGG